MTVEGFSAGTIEFTAGYFSRLPAIIYIPWPVSLYVWLVILVIMHISLKSNTKESSFKNLKFVWTASCRFRWQLWYHCSRDWVWCRSSQMLSWIINIITKKTNKYKVCSFFMEWVSCSPSEWNADWHLRSTKCSQILFQLLVHMQFE